MNALINSKVHGPAIIGENTIIENGHIGTYTSTANHFIIKNSEVVFSIILDECKIMDVDIRIEHSLLDNGMEIIKVQSKPATNRFLIGDQNRIELL